MSEIYTTMEQITSKLSRNLFEVAREEHRRNWQKTAKEDPMTVEEMKRRNAELKAQGMT
jgi:hypothetical protein